MVPKTMKP